MLKRNLLPAFLLIFCSISLSSTINAQERARAEQYNGTVISYNGPRVATAFFTLEITGQTSDEQARGYLATLRDRGQDAALDAIRNQNLGRFSIGSNVGRQINVVRESTVDGRRRIFIVFERWLQIAELRGGYRSVDYPFSVLELFIDERTGKGEGTFIAAARVRFDEDGKNNQQTVEIENFATYPAKLTNVRRSKIGRARV